MLAWIGSPCTLFNTLLWLHVAQPVMHLHAALFKHAQQTPHPAGQKSFLFNMCDFRKSLAYKALVALTLMLTSRTPWAMLEKIVGVHVDQWPPALKRAARTAVLGLLGQVWRRLVDFYLAWPWHLVRIADPDTPSHTKSELANTLFSAPEDCLASNLDGSDSGG